MRQGNRKRMVELQGEIRMKKHPKVELVGNRL